MPECVICLREAPRKRKVCGPDCRHESQRRHGRRRRLRALALRVYDFVHAQRVGMFGDGEVLSFPVWHARWNRLEARNPDAIETAARKWERLKRTLQVEGVPHTRVSVENASDCGGSPSVGIRFDLERAAEWVDSVLGDPLAEVELTGVESLRGCA